MTTLPRPFDENELLSQMHWVRGVALALVKDPHVADDLAQDAWLAAHGRGLVDERGIVGLRAWFATLLRRSARRHRHEDDLRRGREAEASRYRDASPAGDVVERGELQRRISEAVMELEEPWRGAILLRYLDGHSAIDVARIQGVSHDAARKRISRGLEMLRTRLDRAHDGGRETWMHAVGSFLQFSAPAPLALPAHAGAAGVLTIMSIKVALGVVFVALGVVALWSWIGGDRPREEGIVATTTQAEDPRLVDRSETEPGTARGTAAPAPISSGHIVEIVDENGRAWADLGALLVVDGELAQAARTDAGGHARFASVPPRSVLFVGGSGRELVRIGSIDMEPTQRVIVPSGAKVGGSLRFSGDVPLPRLRLEHDEADAAWSRLGPKALAFLAQAGATPAGLTVDVGADGAFAFTGVSSDWTGALVLEGPCAWSEISRRGSLESTSTLLLLAPAADIVLALRGPITVSGRVTDATTKNALPGARVRVLAGAADPQPSPASETTSGADGRFELFLPAPDPERASGRFLLDVSTAGGRVVERRTLIVREGEMRLDAGTVELDVGRSIEILARTSEGAPIEGARANAAGTADAPPSEPSGPDGRTRLLGVGRSVRGIAVAAPGRRTVEIPLPREDAVEVVLAAANVLEIRVVEADGKPAPDARVRIECTRSPFRAGGIAESAGAAPRAFALELDLDGEGRLSLSDLEPGLDLAIAAVDGTRSGADRVSARTPADGVTESVVLTLSTRAFHVHGRIADEHGRGLPRCRIAADWKQGDARARTDADGRFSLGPFRGSVEGVRIEVSRPGFVPSIVERAVVDSAGPPLDVVLLWARTLRARLVQEGGKPFDADTVLATFEGDRAAIGHAVEAGVYDFQDAPPAAGRVDVELGDARYSAEFGPLDAEVVVRAPGLARLTLHLSRAEVQREGTRTCAAIAGAGASPHVERHYFKDAGDGFAPVSVWLAPGTYRVQLERRTLPPRRPGVENLGAPREIVLAAGDEIEMTLP